MRKSRTVAIVALVFISEVLAMGSFMIWGFAKSDRWAVPLVLLIPTVLIWREFISPGGRFIGPVVTPAARALMYGAAVVAVWVAGHQTLAIVEACIFVAASELSRVPGVQEMIARAHGIGAEGNLEPVKQPG